MILITGATGLVGGHLLAQLIAKGEKCRALRRKNSSLDELKLIAKYYKIEFQKIEENTQWVEGDMLDPKSLEIATQGITTLYHCAAVVAFDNANQNRLMNVNIQGTKLICEAALKNDVKQMVMVSSIASLGKSNDGDEINEQTPRDLNLEYNLYSQSKYASEQVVWDYISRGLNASIVNPGIILGVGLLNKGSLQIVEKASKWIPIYTNGTTGYVDVRDVAKSMQRIVELKQWGERFILVSENLSYGDIFKKLSKSLGTPAPLFGLNKVTLSIIASILWLITKLTGASPRLTPAMIRSATSLSFYSNKKAKNILQIEFVSMNESSADIAKWIGEMSINKSK
ncbi:MAG: NAD-dependent epimerase/dehydratase family protein [Bacteroidales bacterium]